MNLHQLTPILHVKIQKNVVFVYVLLVQNMTRRSKPSGPRRRVATPPWTGARNWKRRWPRRRRPMPEPPIDFAACQMCGAHVSVAVMFTSDPHEAYTRLCAECASELTTALPPEGEAPIAEFI